MRFLLAVALCLLALAGCAYVPEPDPPEGWTKHEGSGSDVYPGVERSPSVALAAPKVYKRCADLNAKYPHGVGKPGAKDHTTGTPPVTTFLRNKRLYEANKGRDRDKDGVACEKA